MYVYYNISHVYVYHNHISISQERVHHNETQTVCHNLPVLFNTLDKSKMYAKMAWSFFDGMDQLPCISLVPYMLQWAAW